MEMAFGQTCDGALKPYSYRIMLIMIRLAAPFMECLLNVSCFVSNFLIFGFDNGRIATLVGGGAPFRSYFGK